MNWSQNFWDAAKKTWEQTANKLRRMRFWITCMLFILCPYTCPLFTHGIILILTDKYCNLLFSPTNEELKFCIQPVNKDSHFFIYRDGKRWKTITKTNHLNWKSPRASPGTSGTLGAMKGMFATFCSDSWHPSSSAWASADSIVLCAPSVPSDTIDFFKTNINICNIKNRVSLFISIPHIFFWCAVLL